MLGDQSLLYFRIHFYGTYHSSKNAEWIKYACVLFSHRYQFLPGWYKQMILPRMLLQVTFHPVFTPRTLLFPLTEKETETQRSHGHIQRLALSKQGAAPPDLSRSLKCTGERRLKKASSEVKDIPVILELPTRGGCFSHDINSINHQILHLRKPFLNSRQ